MDSSIRGASHVGSDRLKSLALRIGSSFLICLLAGAALAYPDNDHSALAPLAKECRGCNPLELFVRLSRLR